MSQMIEYLAPFLALLATTLFGALSKIPMKLRPYVAVVAGVLLNLFVNGGLSDGFQIQDVIDGILIGLTAVGIYSGTKNAVEFAKGER